MAASLYIFQENTFDNFARVASMLNRNFSIAAQETSTLSTTTVSYVELSADLAKLESNVSKALDDLEKKYDDKIEEFGTKLNKIEEQQVSYKTYCDKVFTAIITKIDPDATLDADTGDITWSS